MEFPILIKLEKQKVYAVVNNVDELPVGIPFTISRTKFKGENIVIDGTYTVKEEPHDVSDLPEIEQTDLESEVSGQKMDD